MKINLTTESGIAKFAQELNEVQKRCKVRTVTAEQIVKACDLILNTYGIAKKALNGSKFSMDLNAQNFPSAYKSIPESTVIELEFSNGKFFATGIRRSTTHREHHEVEALLSESAKEAIVVKASTLGF